MDDVCMCICVVLHSAHVACMCMYGIRVAAPFFTTHDCVHTPWGQASIAVAAFECCATLVDGAGKPGLDVCVLCVVCGCGCTSVCVCG